ncbi:MAG TPA: glycosyltransferase, partial [Trichocoleus sp.]
MSASVSIIIPTLNEAQYLAQTVRQLTLLDPLVTEVIVVDGGSRDETVAIAKSLVDSLAPIPLTLLHTDQPGRARQMNLGAAHAKGDLLCFLHADTLVPPDLV